MRGRARILGLPNAVCTAYWANKAWALDLSDPDPKGSEQDDDGEIGEVNFEPASPGGGGGQARTAGATRTWAAGDGHVNISIVPLKRWGAAGA